jgi:hypothetical protein
MIVLPSLLDGPAHGRMIPFRLRAAFSPGRRRGRGASLPAAVLCIGIALPGCVGGEADDLPRQAVSGTVTLGGRPLSRGAIQFMPVAAGEGVIAGAIIADGKFNIPRAQGPVLGTYSVSITSESPSEAPPGPPGPTIANVKSAADQVPEKYNTKTSLTRTVEAGRPNTFDFDLQK